MRISSESFMILSYNIVDKRAAILKYFAPSPFHLGRNHSKPSTLIAVGFLNNFEINPKGPLAALTTKITSTLDTTAWHIDKKECINWLNVLVSTVGTYTNLMPFTVAGFFLNKLR